MTNELRHQFVSERSVSSQLFVTLTNNYGLHLSVSDDAVLLITSRTLGEGKSYVAANLRRSLRMEGKNSLLA